METKLTERILREALWNMILEMAKGDLSEARKRLGAYSSYETPAGELVLGKLHVHELEGIHLEIAHDKTEKIYQQWQKAKLKACGDATS